MKIIQNDNCEEKLSIKSTNYAIQTTKEKLKGKFVISGCLGMLREFFLKKLTSPSDKKNLKFQCFRILLTLSNLKKPCVCSSARMFMSEDELEFDGLVAGLEIEPKLFNTDVE